VEIKIYCNLVERNNIHRNFNRTCNCSGAFLNTYTLLLEIKTTPAISEFMLTLCIISQFVSVVSLLFALVFLVSLRGSSKSSCAERTFNSDRRTRKHLCAAPALLHICILLRPVAIAFEASCKLLAVLINFFLLFPGVWMLTKGLRLYHQTSSKAIYTRETKEWWKKVVMDATSTVCSTMPRFVVSEQRLHAFIKKI